MIRIVTLALAALALASGCASSGPRGVAEPRAQDIAAFEQIKALEGTWQMPGEDGRLQDAAIFAVSSNGAVVREIMFPGTSHEMTNLYHLDGPSLVMTHYCAIGNQPRMRAVSARQGEIPFRFDSVTNYVPAHKYVMDEMTLVIEDSDRIVQRWQSRARDGTRPPETVFTLVRAR